MISLLSTGESSSCSTARYLVRVKCELERSSLEYAELEASHALALGDLDAICIILVFLSHLNLNLVATEVEAFEKQINLAFSKWTGHFKFQVPTSQDVRIVRARPPRRHHSP